MSANKLYNGRPRSERSFISAEPRTRPYLHRRSRLEPRQSRGPPELPAKPPSPSFEGDESSGDESDEEGESDSEGEDISDDEEEEAENVNPFAPSGATGSGIQGSIAPTTTMPDNPFATSLELTTSSATLTKAPATTAMPTSLDLLSASATEAASTSKGPGGSDPSLRHSDTHTTAIALGSVLGVLSVAVTAFLLLRYCTPLKARVASFRERRGSKLLGEEDGAPPQHLGGGMVQSGEFAALNASRYPTVAPSSIATPAPSYTPATAIALPITSTRALAPTSIHTSPRDDDPQNPFSDYAQSLSRSHSNGSARSKQRTTRDSRASDYESSRPTTDTLNAPGTYAFNFNFDDYRMSTTDIRPTGLTNNPPSVVSRSASGSRNNVVARPLVPLPGELGSGLGLDIAISPQTPKPAHFPIPYAPPSEVDTPRTQYMPRIRQSITPSESVSNAPYSPLPFPAGLVPAMPADSRWSRNSSSVWTRTVEERAVSQAGARANKAARPPPLPLAVRTSTSSLSSLSSRGSRRSSGRDSSIETSQGSKEKQGIVQQEPANQPKASLVVVGLPSSVRPPSSTGSGVTLQPVAYRP